jgi:hypothetical protein
MSGDHAFLSVIMTHDNVAIERQSAAIMNPEYGMQLEYK